MSRIAVLLASMLTISVVSPSVAGNTKRDVCNKIGHVMKNDILNQVQMATILTKMKIAEPEEGDGLASQVFDLLEDNIEELTVGLEEIRAMCNG